MARKILIMGLPGAGKTTLAEALVRRIQAVHFNADALRAEINKDLGFAPADRLEQARRMGWLCDRVVAAGTHAIADFVCPTAATRAAFGSAFIVFVDRITEGRFDDTNRLFEPPDAPDIRVHAEGTSEFWTEAIARKMEIRFNPRRPTALFVGRYQPFHDGHKALIEEGLRQVGQVCIAVRDTYGLDGINPFPFPEVKARIEVALAAHRGLFEIISVPNITDVLYGRDVGYRIARIDLDADLQAISATTIRRRIGAVY